MIGVGRKKLVNEFEDLDEGEISENGEFEEVADKGWFSMGMSREEKVEARRLWRNNMILKLLGRNTCYHYL